MSIVSSGIVSFFTQDHRECDEVWAQVEAAVNAKNNEGAKVAWTSFDKMLRAHLAMEEEVLFPAFEKATGMTGGPTAMMRMEHTQMRGMLEQMSEDAESGDLESLADQGDTLLMLIQQHNMKEENILYPMCEQNLSSHWAQLGPVAEQMYEAGRSK
ncbi:MAG: hemerythrin domain-containing protein [Myxococcales bacterium]|nr:hemerythrin domain-containing protein [Myxococcales bacterium]